MRDQIEMRVIGLGWTQFETRWSSSNDETVGTVEYLSALLNDILAHEATERHLKNLPTEAAPPPLGVRKLKELGTVSIDAEELAGRVRDALPPLPCSPAARSGSSDPSPPPQSLFDTSELKEKAEAERRRRVAAGISDDVEDEMPLNAPAFAALLHKKIEVCWPYMDKNSGKRVLIWSAGKVTKVADGEMDKRSQKARQILPAGAVYWEWDAEDEFEEQAGGQWLVLDPKQKWNRAVAYGWRWHPEELAKLDYIRAAREEQRQRNASAGR